MLQAGTAVGTTTTGFPVATADGPPFACGTLELTPGNLITHLRKLEDAGYLSSETTGNGRASRTAVELTHRGRAALDAYTEALRGLLNGL